MFRCHSLFRHPSLTRLRILVYYRDLQLLSLLGILVLLHPPGCRCLRLHHHHRANHHQVLPNHLFFPHIIRMRNRLLQTIPESLVTCFPGQLRHMLHRWMGNLVGEVISVCLVMLNISHRRPKTHLNPASGNWRLLRHFPISGLCRLLPDLLHPGTFCATCFEEFFCTSISWRSPRDLSDPPLRAALPRRSSPPPPFPPRRFREDKPFQLSTSSYKQADNRTTPRNKCDLVNRNVR